MANKSISQLTSAAAVAETDLLATAIVDGGSATGYATRKHTVADVGAHIGTTKTFAGLNTTSKNLVGAANEVLSNFADEYDDTATYDVGDIVVYEGGLYKCITAVSVAESFDSTKWTKGTAADFFGGGGSDVAVNGNFGGISTLKIVNGVLSNISSGQYFYPLTREGNAPTYDMTKTLKIHMKVKCSSLLSRSQALIGNNASFYYFPSFEFQNSASANLLWAGFSTSGGTWNSSLEVTKAEIPFVSNQWYFIDYEWKNGEFSLTVSDGTNTVTKSVQTAHFYQTSTGRTQIGTVSDSANHYAPNCTFDMNDTYCEQDDVIIWGNKHD